MTFAELFWDIWKNLKYQLPEEKTLCYMFEMISHRNPIVVMPESESIVLHGARDLKTLTEREPKPIADRYGWECVPTYSYSTLEEIIEASKRLNPTKSGLFSV